MITKFVAALLIAFSAFQEGPPYATYDERGRMVSIVGLLDSEGTQGCARLVRSGHVTLAEYDEKRQLVGFTLKQRKRRPVRIYIGEPPQGARVPSMRSLVKKGARLRVTAYGCGISAAVLEADEIRAL